MRVLTIVISFFILSISLVHASQWEGEWDFERNSRELSGFLNIHNCQSKTCKFNYGHLMVGSIVELKMEH